jgi:trehalose 6-phosphate phosphatase
LTRPLFGRTTWARARAVLQSRRSILIGLDLDGTLAPLARHPDLARVPAATLQVIQQTARAVNTRIAILSARPERDLRRLLPLRDVLLVGQYGLEGPLAPSPGTLARIHRRCARVTRALRPLVTPVRGALLEAKGLTVAVHFRNVASGAAKRALHRDVRRIASREAVEEDFVPIPGAEIVDFVPRGHDKGEALSSLRRQLRPAAVFYFGDSGGDEPAFAALGKNDVSVRVGRGMTCARYRVQSLGGVTRFLDAVRALRGRPA